MLPTMNSGTLPATALHPVVGFDGSPPASRALDAAVRLMEGRAGQITVVYVAHLPSTDMLSADAIGEMEETFDEVETELRGTVSERLRDHPEGWRFERRQGMIADQLIAAAKDTQAGHPGAAVVIVVGSSSQAMHRVVGSVPVSLARHSPVPLMVVP
jgi:nucleotide-binding universal stress UspA family protein